MILTQSMGADDFCVSLELGSGDDFWVSLELDCRYDIWVGWDSVFVNDL